MVTKSTKQDMRLPGGFFSSWFGKPTPSKEHVSKEKSVKGKTGANGGEDRGQQRNITLGSSPKPVELPRKAPVRAHESSIWVRPSDRGRKTRFAVALRSSSTALAPVGNAATDYKSKPRAVKDLTRYDSAAEHKHKRQVSFTPSVDGRSIERQQRAATSLVRGLRDGNHVQERMASIPAKEPPSRHEQRPRTTSVPQPRQPTRSVDNSRHVLEEIPSRSKQAPRKDTARPSAERHPDSRKVGNLALRLPDEGLTTIQASSPARTIIVGPGHAKYQRAASPTSPPLAIRKGPSYRTLDASQPQQRYAARNEVPSQQNRDRGYIDFSANKRARPPARQQTEAERTRTRTDGNVEPTDYARTATRPVAQRARDGPSRDAPVKQQPQQQEVLRTNHPSPAALRPSLCLRRRTTM